MVLLSTDVEITMLLEFLLSPRGGVLPKQRVHVRHMPKRSLKCVPLINKYTSRA
jgi:hypothetical protein